MEIAIKPWNKSNTIGDMSSGALDVICLNAHKRLGSQKLAHLGERSCLSSSDKLLYLPNYPSNMDESVHHGWESSNTDGWEFWKKMNPEQSSFPIIIGQKKVTKWSQKIEPNSPPI